MKLNFRGSLLKLQSFVLLIVLFVVLSSQFYCDTPKPSLAPKSFSSLNDTVKYVGMNTCKECHESIYNTYIETGMGKSFDHGTINKSAADFSNGALVSDQYKDLNYLMSLHSDSLFLNEFRLRGADTIYKRSEKVDYIVGSGQHTNSHIMNTGGYLNQMPLTFYTQEGTWDLPPGYENGGNTRFDRRIGLECMSCHNAYPEFVLGSTNKFKNIASGIDCERCHGPGEVHVSNMRQGKLVDISKQIDYSIVNPSKLPIDLQFDICQRCHVQGNAVLNDESSFYDFRPGMKLSDVMDIYMPVYSGTENDHIMASHAERLKLSKCYTKSIEKIRSRSNDETSTEADLRPYKNALTCITCHNPHVSSRVKTADSFNSSCNNCHGVSISNICTEDQSVLTANNNNCVSCHMPTNNTLDIPHVTVHDHYIKIPLTLEEENQVKKFLGIEAINNASPSGRSKGKAFIAYFEKFGFDTHVLDSAQKYFDPQSREDIHSLVQISYLRKNYSEVVEIAERFQDLIKDLNKKSFSNVDAWTAFRIADSYYELGSLEEALTYFQCANALAPFDMKFANKFGVVLMQLQRFEEARTVFEGMIAEYPKMPEPWSNLGFIVLSLDRDSAKALRHYNKALELDPDYRAGLMNEIGLYIFRRDFVKVRSLLNLFLKKYPNDPQALNLQEQIKGI